jgi:hypothetical protein
MSKIITVYQKALGTSVRRYILGKEVFSTHITCIKIGNERYPTEHLNRTLFIDENHKLWFKTRNDNGACKYAITKPKCGRSYQTLNLGGAKPIRIYEDDTIIVAQAEQQTPLPSMSKTFLKVDEEYKLRNGLKMKIIANVSNEDYTNQETFVGIYKISDNHAMGTIRYDAFGSVLSHGKDSNYEVVDKWKERDVWVVVVQVSGPIEFESKTFLTKEAAERYQKLRGAGIITKVTMEK